MNDSAIQVAADEIVSLVGSFAAIDTQKDTLTQSEVDDLSYEAVTIKEAIKKLSTAAEERIGEIKQRFFRVADEEAGEMATYTLYSTKHAMKLERLIAKIGGGIDEAAVLSGLYEHFDESPGDTTGRAWAVWQKITDPVQKRVINEGKLESELARAIEHEGGKKHGSTVNYLPIEVVNAARVPEGLQARFTPKRMSAAEKKAHGLV